MPQPGRNSCVEHRIGVRSRSLDKKGAQGGGYCLGWSMTKPAHMRQRADFLRAQKGIRRSASGLLLEVCPTPEGLAATGGYRVGFTASRKVGGAVERNRAKRRLRAAAAEVLPVLALERTDYVFIAKVRTLTVAYADLIADLTRVVQGANRILHKGGGGG
jgi:ribonuclease P protein component